MLRDRLRDEVGSERFARYFGDGANVAFDREGVEVVVPSTFMADLINRRFGGSLRRAAAASTDQASAEVRVRVERTARQEPPKGSIAAPAQSASPRKSRKPAELLRLRHRLDDFIVGESNRLAHAAAVRIATGVEDAAFSPLFLHGPSGVGKTHLLQGIAARYAQLHPGRSIRYVTAEAFTNEYITAIRANSTDRFRRAWRNTRLLCLDDVHFLRGKQSTQVELLHTLDAIGLHDARIVLASDEHPRRIDQLGDHLVSRFMSGAVIRIDEPDEELTRRLIAELAARRGLRLTQDGIAALMQRALKSAAHSVRELEGMLTQLEAVERLAPDLCGAGAGWDAGAVRRSLGLAEGSAARAGAERRPVRLEAIRDEVCRTMRVEPTDLLGSGRHARVVLARGLIVRLARELTAMSFPEIARGLKRPNHSTVITAHKRVCSQLESGAMLKIGSDFAGLTLADLLARVRGRVLEASGR
jgi:chromosomal replication initiator protein